MNDNLERIRSMLSAVMRHIEEPDTVRMLVREIEAILREVETQKGSEAPPIRIFSE